MLDTTFDAHTEFEAYAEPLAHFERITLLAPPAAAAPAAPRKSALRSAAWVAGSALIIVGGLDMRADKWLAILDIACVVVGVAALPPIADFLRRRIHAPGWAHFLIGVGVLLAAGALSVSGVFRGPAPFPQHIQGPAATFGAVSLTDPAVPAASEDEKQAYLVQVRNEMKAMRAERAALAGPTTISAAPDEATLDQRAALSLQGARFDLSPAEASLVGRLAANVATTRKSMLPGARQAYVDALNGPLATYGLSARLVGDDGVEFAGSALADPSKRQSLLTMTRADRAELGLNSITFAAPALQEATISQETRLDVSYTGAAH